MTRCVIGGKEKVGLLLHIPMMLPLGVMADDFVSAIGVGQDLGCQERAEPIGG